MPKLPKGKEMVKKLEAIGFVIRRIKGSHTILKKDQVTIVVAVHAGKEVKVGFFKDALQQLGLSEKDFWDI